jgi:hypothetical protein
MNCNISKTNLDDLFNKTDLDSSYYNNSYSVHSYGKISKKYKINADGKSSYSKIARQNCNHVYEYVDYYSIFFD